MKSEVKFAWKMRVSADGKFDPSTLLKFVSEDELVEKLTASHLSEADNFSPKGDLRLDQLIRGKNRRRVGPGAKSLKKRKIVRPTVFTE